VTTIARSDQGAALSEHTVPETDALLWDRAADGDRSAFAVLFDRHVESLWNHAYRLTGSWSQAQDIASATFLTAWTKRGEVKLVRESALPWLYAVAGNIARNENRRSARFLRAVRRLPHDETVDDHADSVARRVDNDRRTREVADAVRGLPAAERAAVELCLLGELSTADAATLLGIAEVSVRSRLSRARARLRKVLEGTS